MDRRILSRSLRRNEPIGLFQRNAWAVGRVAGTLRADALVVPLGLDAFEGDPFGGLSVFHTRICADGRGDQRCRLAHACRTVIVQEGAAFAMLQALTSLDGIDPLMKSMSLVVLDVP